MLQRVIGYFFPARIRDMADLRAFIRAEATYLANKVSIGYCRMKAPAAFDSLLADRGFREQLDICRWESYSLILADMLILAEAFLRGTELSTADNVAGKLGAEYESILNGQELPVHRASRGWQDRIADFHQRFLTASIGIPSEPAAVPRATAKIVFALLPIHENFKGNDAALIASDLGFSMTAFWETMERRVERARLRANIAA